jgi:hypothetical protein
LHSFINISLVITPEWLFFERFIYDLLINPIMERDYVIVSMVTAMILLALAGSVLFVVERNNYSDQQLLTDYVPVEQPQEFAPTWNDLIAGTTVVYVTEVEVPIESDETEEPTETDDSEEIEEEQNELEILLDDLEQLFNDIDNFGDDLTDIEDSIEQADDEDDLEDLEEDLEDIEDDELRDLEDDVEDIKDRFTDLDQDDFDVDDDEWEDIENSIENAEDNYDDARQYFNTLIDLIQDRYEEV